MNKKHLIEYVVKVIVAALTAFLTALGTTSCMH
ncbi:MAG: smalltalk protein [Bacteroidaceae bacterium]|nr:smalltalk protein [Bacteroidaceae bacterium]